VKVNALAAGTPVAYGRIVEWKGRPEVDIFWGGESALFDKLAEQKLVAPLALPEGDPRRRAATIGKPKPIYLKDRRRSGSARRSSLTASSTTRSCSSGSGCRAQDWDDLLNPKLKGHVAQCAPTRSSSSHATYEVILQLHGDARAGNGCSGSPPTRAVHRTQPRRPVRRREGRVRGRFRSAELHGLRGAPRRVRDQVTSRRPPRGSRRSRWPCWPAASTPAPRRLSSSSC